MNYFSLFAVSLVPLQAGSEWQVQLRTLFALEAVLAQGMTQACGEVAVMFQSDPAPVRALSTSTNAQVREQGGHLGHASYQL